MLWCVLLVMAMSIPAARAGRVKTPADTITAATAFLRIPQQELDLLSLSMRQDMLDYMQQRDSVYKKANIYRGLSWIETLKPDYISVHLSEVSSLQIKLLPLKGSGLPLVMTVYTIDDGNGTADSTVSFYDNSMRPLPTGKYLKTPDPKDFYDIPKDAPVSRHDMEEAFPFYTFCMKVDPESGNLTGELTSANMLTLEQSELLKPYLRTALHWDWTGKNFRLRQ